MTRPVTTRRQNLAAIDVDPMAGAMARLRDERPANNCGRCERGKKFEGDASRGVQDDAFRWLVGQ